MGYATVLFDLDYTLFDSETSQREAVASTIAPLDIDQGPAIETFLEINGSLWRDVEAGLLTPNDVRVLRFTRFLAAVEAEADPVALGNEYVEALGTHGHLYPGAREVLERLRGTVSLGLITNGIGDVQRARLERLELEQYFSAIVISGEVGVAKPGPEIFDIAFGLLDHPPKEATVMVGDSLTSDIAGGRGYGIATCWYNPHDHPTDGTAATHVITKIEDVIDLAGIGAGDPERIET